jgi:D-tyrosyl-tRNA(Tyr) deacylase
MRAVVQRVARAAVRVDGDTVGEIGSGLLVLLGVGHDDSPAEASALVDKLVGLRIFPDDEQKMNLSLSDIGGSVLVVSQFTLLADVRKGRRPSFTGAAPPDLATEMVDQVVKLLRRAGLEVATGEFGAMMDVELLNSGPVTIVIEVADGRVQ